MSIGQLIRYLICRIFGICANPSAVSNLKVKGFNMATATLTWSPPTTRTDVPPTPLPPDQIAGADIYDSASLTPTMPIGSVMGAAGTFMTAVLSVGIHNFTVVTRDTTGHSSAPSNVASVTVVATLANPSAVTDLMAVLNP